MPIEGTSVTSGNEDAWLFEVFEDGWVWVDEVFEVGWFEVDGVFEVGVGWFWGW